VRLAWQLKVGAAEAIRMTATFSGVDELDGRELSVAADDSVAVTAP
jgi:hypothetical protein